MNAGAYSPPFNARGVNAQTTMRLAVKPANNPNRRNDRHMSHARIPPADAKTNHATTYDIYSNPFHDLPRKIIRMNIFLRHHIAVHTDSRPTNFVSIPSKEGMPLIKGTTFIQ